MGDFVSLFSSDILRKQNHVSRRLMKGQNAMNNEILLTKFKEVKQKDRRITKFNDEIFDKFYNSLQ